MREHAVLRIQKPLLCDFVDTITEWRIMNNHEQKIKQITGELTAIGEQKFEYFKENSPALPRRRDVVDIIVAVRHVLFPKYCAFDSEVAASPEAMLDYIYRKLERVISLAFDADNCNRDVKDMAYEILATLPKIKELLIKDAEAIYEGDPAACGTEEVILSYPGFTAISVYRLAHEFYKRKIPYIPRIMTEYAHEITGIDIHAGATIGEYFFIDHGTGIVIGETTTIGKRVKIYQGVTLGAKSFELDEAGNPVKGIKRHPDIADNVIIYANATILGGNTKIGEGCIIGANVWLTRSVEAGKTVYYTENSK